MKMLLSEAIRKNGIFGAREVCPHVGCGDHRTFHDMIWHLAMQHGWPDDRLADWVAEQEKRLRIAE
jgi:hypothetical protein